MASLCAGIRPSLDLSICSWNATDILVLSPTQKKPNFEVVEVIKGETRRGSILALPELSPTDGVRWPLRELASLFGIYEAAPPVTPSDRIIVFLRRPGAAPEYYPRPDLPAKTEGWQPANWFGDLRTSAVWLQDGGVYAYLQTVNPGPTHLIDFQWSEEKIRAEIQRVLELRRSLDEALDETEPAERANRLALIVRSSDRIARSSALHHLANGGATAAVALEKLLDDENLLSHHDSIIAALVKTGVRTPRLGRIIEEETRYWTYTCPILQPGWWSPVDPAEVEIAQSHYMRVSAALEGIRALEMTDLRPTVQKFAAIWRTCPSLDEHEPIQSDSISQECDSLLASPLPRHSNH